MAADIPQRQFGRHEQKVPALGLGRYHIGRIKNGREAPAGIAPVGMKSLGGDARAVAERTVTAQDALGSKVFLLRNS
ncbi:MAG: hypothetical protein ABIS06_03740 [Vicinamibacterales bacterium]